MAGPKVTSILKSKSELSGDEIAQMTDAEGWAYIYKHFPPKTKRKKVDNQICFTGFSTKEKAALVQIATDNGLGVVSSVTKKLEFLVVGENAGPAKLKKAEEQGVPIMDVEQFDLFLREGELPN